MHTPRNFSKNSSECVGPHVRHPYPALRRAVSESVRSYLSSGRGRLEQKRARFMPLRGRAQLQLGFRELPRRAIWNCKTVGIRWNLGWFGLYRRHVILPTAYFAAWMPRESVRRANSKWQLALRRLTLHLFWLSGSGPSSRLTPWSLRKGRFGVAK